MNKTFTLLFVCTVSFSCSHDALVKSGWKKYRKGDYTKAEVKFNKALSKSESPDALEGRAFSKFKRGNTSSGLIDIENAATKSSRASFTYNAAMLNAEVGKNESSFNLLCSIYRKNNYTNYIQKAKTEKAFRSLQSQTKFRRMLDGYRRVKVSILEGKSNRPDDKGICPLCVRTGNDQFVVVAGSLPNGKQAVLLCTNTIQDNNNVRWNNQYTVFDYKLGTSIAVAQIDEEVTSHDLLSRFEGSIFSGGTFKTSGNYNSSVIYSIEDTEQSGYTAGVNVPKTIRAVLV